MRRQRLLGFPVLLTLAVLIVEHASSAQMAQTTQGTNAQSGQTIAEPTISASEVLARLDSSRQTVRRMLEQARKERDVIKTLCLDDKLNQIDVAIRDARLHKDALDGSVKKNDLELARRELTALNVQRERVERLVADANICVSKETESVGDLPPGGLAIDPSIADEAAYYPPGIIIIEPPPTGSVIK